MKKEKLEQALDILLKSLLEGLKNPDDENNNSFKLTYHELRLLIDTIQEVKNNQELLNCQKSGNK